MDKLLHVISHTDLDGVTAAAVAWHGHFPERSPVKVTLTGYGEVDALILETMKAGQDLLVVDLFCQRRETVDEMDRFYEGVASPVLFDHHKTTAEVFSNRKWAVVDVAHCAAKVYYLWLLERTPEGPVRDRLLGLERLVEIANDRDLWLGRYEESRHWQALITLCGPWSVFCRLVADGRAEMSPHELTLALDFIARQEERFRRALEQVERHGDDLALVPTGILDFGDASDFCGLILDRSENPPEMVAVCSRRVYGDWAVSLRSRQGLAARIVGLLKDGKKVRGGGHGDAAALYFPAHFSQSQIRDTLLSGIRTARDQERPVGLTLGDLLRAKMEGK
ncbi:phosphohydrolase [Aminithiophilus ramosus]|uniref:Phosphohydrolase n=1 Tax=Aminithiophilus ramosus TaxID=3029084 RepID=A0A9Q7AQX1_9BACT|nr:phosphohydrolase [Aminithiophilus ramosus]QTX32376.1 phosphohydrolase [Aminithiophilus ramosus]